MIVKVQLLIGLFKVLSQVVDRVERFLDVVVGVHVGTPINIHKQQTRTELKHSRHQEDLKVLVTLLGELGDQLCSLFHYFVRDHHIRGIVLQNIVASGHHEYPQGVVLKE